MIKLNKNLESITRFIIFSIFITHNLYFILKIGNYWDEKAHIETGGSALNSIKEFLTGEYTKETSSLFNPEYYGSIFLLPQHIITKFFIEKKYLFSFLQRNEYIFNEIDYYFFIRHLIVTLFVAFTFILISLMLDSLFSKKSTNLFLIFTLFFPRFLGHTTFNGLDIPFATFMFLAFVFFFYEVNRKKGFANFSNISLTIQGLLFSFLICVRGNAFVFIFILFIYTLFFEVRNKNLNNFINKSIKLFISTVIFSYVFSPKGWRDPIKYLEGVYSVQFNVNWVGSTLTNGDFIIGQNTTSNYLIIWLFFTIPIIYFLYFYLFIRHNDKKLEFSLENFSLFFIFIVIVLHIIFTPISYNGIRHYLFLVPFFGLICSFGFDRIQNYKVKTFMFLLTLSYLILTQFQFDQYKYSYFNEFVSTEELSTYCTQNINGCGLWGTDYYAISGKEFSFIVDKHEDDINNLFVCYPTESLTPYLTNTDKFSYPFLWTIKSDAPTQNETDGFEQFKIVYSEGHFKEFILNQDINVFYTYSIHNPQKKQNTCNFHLFQNEKKIICEYVDSVARNIRNRKVHFSYLSKCLMKNI